MMQHYRTHMAPKSRRKHHPYPYLSSSPESSIHKGATIQSMIMAPVPLKHAFICSDALVTFYRPCSPCLPSPPMSPPLLPAPRTLEPAIESPSSLLFHPPLKNSPSTTTSSSPSFSNPSSLLHRQALKSFG